MWKRVLWATAFNILFEYSMRGVNNLRAHRLLPLLIFGTYFTVFVLFETLIHRFALKDVHLMVAAFFLGTIYQCFVSGNSFIQPYFLGLNWSRLFFVTLVWWGALQTVMTFYIATRLSPRDPSQRPLPWRDWVTFFLLNGFMVFVFQAGGQIPQGSLLGKASMIVVLVIVARVFFAILPREKDLLSPTPFRKDAFMDVLAALTTAVFIFSGVFLTYGTFRAGGSVVNAPAVRLVFAWTILLAPAMLVYRLVTRRPIPV